MAEVCILYSREDRKLVEKLDSSFRKRNWTVWWDKQLRDGSLTEQIQRQINDAKCVLVVWSATAVTKRWVRDEARYTIDVGKPLIPIRVDSCVIPVPFGDLQTLELNGWNGSDTPHFLQLVDSIRHHIGGQGTWDRKSPTYIELPEKKLILPAFFRSVSSYETQLRPDAAMRLLELLSTDTVLLSAYDLALPKDTPGARKAKQLSASALRLKQRNSVVMVDSGNYEAYRKQDRGWTRTKFLKSLSKKYFDYVFCFDNLKPPSDTKNLVLDVVKRTMADRNALESEAVLPIVHLPFTKSGKFKTALAPEIFTKVSSTLGADFIAIPERELGDGLLEKARVVSSIRQALNSLGKYQPVHLLGTGNPLSVAVLAASGADSFDGLEWCRTAADFDTAHLFHFHQYDFLRDQTGRAESPLVRLSVEDKKISYDARVGLHNLEFCRVWISDLQKHAHGGTFETLLRPMIPGPFVSELKKVLTNEQK